MASKRGHSSRTVSCLVLIIVFLLVSQESLTARNLQRYMPSSLSAASPEVASINPTSQIEAPKSVLHILHGVHGNKPAFLDAWEVNLKSILLNAPPDHDLHLHIMANQDATTSMKQRIKNTGLTNSSWRNQISISIYNVDQYEVEWTQFLNSKIRDNKMDDRVTLGGYYRLMANQILPKHTNATIGPILYMDVDVVILTNLNDLIRYIDDGQTNSNVLYQWSGKKDYFSPNSGFVVFHLDRFHNFWQLLDSLPSITNGGDQALLTMVHEAFPNATGALPPEFDTHLGHGWRPRPHTLLQQQNKVGMVHFTGGPPRGQNFMDSDIGVDKYCMRVPKCNNSPEAQAQFRQTWGLVDYYVRIPWHWVLYFGSSHIPVGSQQGGFPLKFKVIQD